MEILIPTMETGEYDNRRTLQSKSHWGIRKCQPFRSIVFRIWSLGVKSTEMNISPRLVRTWLGLIRINETTDLEGRPWA